MRWLLTTVVLLVLFYPSSGLTQTVCGPQDYDSKQAPNFDCPGPEEEALVPRLNPPPSIPVHQGKVVEAPWDGALVHRDRLVALGLKIKALRRLRWADRLYIAERYRIEIEHARATGTIREALLEEQAEYHRERATAAERSARRASAWYRSWWFGFLSGTLVSAALVALAAYVVTAI